MVPLAIALIVSNDFWANIFAFRLHLPPWAAWSSWFWLAEDTRWVRQGISWGRVRWMWWEFKLDREEGFTSASGCGMFRRYFGLEERPQLTAQLPVFWAEHLLVEDTVFGAASEALFTSVVSIDFKRSVNPSKRSCRTRCSFNGCATWALSRKVRSLSWGFWST